MLSAALLTPTGVIGLVLVALGSTMACIGGVLDWTELASSGFVSLMIGSTLVAYGGASA